MTPGSCGQPDARHCDQGQPYLHHQLAAGHLQQAAQSHADQDVWGTFRMEMQHRGPRKSDGAGHNPPVLRRGTPPPLFLLPACAPGLLPSPKCRLFLANTTWSTQGASAWSGNHPKPPGWWHSLSPSFPLADPESARLQPKTPPAGAGTAVRDRRMLLAPSTQVPNTTPVPSHCAGAREVATIPGSCPAPSPGCPRSEGSPRAGGRETEAAPAPCTTTTPLAPKGY